MQKSEVIAASWWIAILSVFGAILLWCLCSHCIFMRYCLCLKKTKKIRYSALKEVGWPLSGAHRGGSCERAENTIGAFKHAMSCGMNLMECDVHLSKDGQVVIAHDSTLERMCGTQFIGKKVSDYNFEDLPKFQKIIPLHLQEGSYTL